MTDSPANKGTNTENQVEHLEGEDDYKRAMRRAMALMEKGFNLGGSHKLDREALHDRKALREADSH